MCSDKVPPRFNCDGSMGSRPIEFELPSDGFHKGVLWAGLADNWKHKLSFRMVDDKLVSDSWTGNLINSSSN
jgi:hypothetical protein